MTKKICEKKERDKEKFGNRDSLEIWNPWELNERKQKKKKKKIQIIKEEDWGIKKHKLNIERKVNIMSKKVHFFFLPQ